MQKFIITITKTDFSLLALPCAECFILPAALPEEFVCEFASKAQAENKIVLAQTAELCLRHDLDGVLLDLSKSANIAADFKKETTGLKNKFTGIICRNRRHEAMLASECEPDFVAFKVWTDGQEKIRDLTDWYNEFFLIQSALIPQDEVDFLKFKTDFVVLDDTKYKIFVANQ